MSSSARRAVIVVTHLTRFVADSGNAVSHEVLLDPDLVEAFVVRGLSGRAPSTKGTYRSVLLHSTYRSVLLGEAEALGHSRSGRGTPFPAAPAPRPYSFAERAELVAMARAQRHQAMADAALALIAFGVGAGMSARELIATCWNDVSIDQGRILVAIGGNRARTVPVGASWRLLIRELADRSSGGFCFRPGPADRSYKNFVSDFTAHLVADPGATRLSLQRARSSFLCDHLEAATPLLVLLEIAGLSEVESLLRFARHVQSAPHSKAALRRRLKDERR